jgi:tetratricopeptide (TPR) repeat protein
MMKKCFFFTLTCILLFTFFSFTSIAEDSLIMPADALFEKGDINSMLESIPLYIKAVEANPNDYEANWKCARAHREYANLAFQQEIEGWEDICKKYGKDGMNYGKKAIELMPEKIDGHYWYGVSAGTYSDGVSILKALKEGLKKSTEKAFETAYAMDKMYEDGGPMLCLGRFWHQLPFPMKNKKRALGYFEEFQKYFPNDPQGQVFYAELLIDMREKSLAKPFLEKAAASDHPYYSKRAKELLEEKYK